MIGEEFELNFTKNSTVLVKEDLIRFIKLIVKKKTLLEKIEKRGMPPVLTELLINLIKDESSLKDLITTENIVTELKKLSICNSIDVVYEEEHGLYTIKMGYTYKGIDCTTDINWDYLTGPLFSEVNQAHEKINEFPVAPYLVKSGQEHVTYDTPENLVNGLFESVKKGIYIQRYKGLGEMNPNQLWETTMNPENRTLLKVNINDYLESEQIFDTLMGLDANKRKEFILSNALNARNLDI
jgi:DNA gyrase subunit B